MLCRELSLFPSLVNNLWLISNISPSHRVVPLPALELPGEAFSLFDCRGFRRPRCSEPPSSSTALSLINPPTSSSLLALMSPPDRWRGEFSRCCLHCSGTWSPIVFVLLSISASSLPFFSSWKSEGFSPVIGPPPFSASLLSMLCLYLLLSIY